MIYKGLVLLADGFEQVEALAYVDILTRAGIQVDLVSIKNCHKVTSSSHITVVAKYNLKEIDYTSYDFIYLPGGKLGVDNLQKSKKVRDILKYFYDNNDTKLIIAICAAPSILGVLGYLDDKKYTCFPGFERGKGKYLENETCVVDGNIYTARSMYWTIQLAEKVVEHYLGKGGLEKIYPGTRGVR